MTFDAPLALSRPGRAGRLIAGTVTAAAGPTLLSRSFRSRLLGPLPAPDPVRLGTASAYRYSGLRVRGSSGSLVVYTAPTTAGVATVACSAPDVPDRAFGRDCARIASTLRVFGAGIYPLGPSPADAAVFSATFARLGADTRGPLAGLGSARDASAQARAAGQLAGAYGAAADRLSGAMLSPRDRDQRDSIVGALRRCADAYDSAAAAAGAVAAVPAVNAISDNAVRARAAGAYGAAEGAVGAASAGLSQALRGLRRLGYTVSGQR